MPFKFSTTSLGRTSDNTTSDASVQTQSANTDKNTVSQDVIIRATRPHILARRMERAARRSAH